MINISPIIQTENNCGPACLAMVANFFGIKTTQESIAKVAGTNHLGTNLEGIYQAAHSLGLQGYHKDNARISDLKTLSQNGIPVMVDWFIEVTGHYSIVCQIDEENIYLRDPIQEEIRVVNLSEFEQIWFDFEGAAVPEKETFFVRRAIVVLPPTRLALGTVDSQLLLTLNFFNTQDVWVLN